MFLRILGIFLSVLLGLIFIYSGYSKLYPVIETFEFTFIDIGVANWHTAPVIARLFIALEFFTGILLILNIRLKKFTLPFTTVLLLIFILYLIVQIVVSGNSGSCGCFGEHIPMTPLQAIFKNLVMLMMIAFLFIIHESDKKNYRPLFYVLIALPCLTLPFVVNPVDYAYSSNNLDEKINYPLDLELLYRPSDPTKVQIPKIELRKGKHVIAFLSLSCSHCQIAAKKFRLIKKNNPALSIYFVLNGNSTEYKFFMEETRSANIPHSFCLGKSFVHLASAKLPRIYYLEDGRVVKKVDHFELNQYDIEKWMFAASEIK